MQTKGGGTSLECIRDPMLCAKCACTHTNPHSLNFIRLFFV